MGSTPDSNILLLSFSNNFGEIFQQYTKYSNISVEGYNSVLSQFTYVQLSTIDDYQLILEFNSTVTNHPLLTLTLHLPPQCIYNTSNNLKLTTKKLTINLLDQYALDASTKSLIANTKQTTESMNSAASNAFVANNMIPSGASFAFRCLISMDTIRFLRFFIIDYPPNVLAMFQTNLPTSDIIPNINLDENPEDGSLPDIFQNYNISIYIFNNCGNNLIELLSYIVLGFGVMIVMKVFFRKIESKLLKVFFIILKTIFVWNFSLSNALSGFMSYSLYTFLSWRFPASNTLMGKFNWFFSVFMGFAMFAVLLFVFLTIRKLRPFILEQVLYFYLSKIFIKTNIS